MPIHELPAEFWQRLYKTEPGEKSSQIILELLQVWKQKNIAIIHKLASYQSGSLPINDVLYVQILSVG